MGNPMARTDLLEVESLFTEEELLARDTVRSWAREEWLPLLEKDYEDGVFRLEKARELAQLGALGSTIRGYECAGLSHTAYGLIMQELEWVDSGLRSFVSVQGALCMYPIYRFGSEDQKQKYLPRMAAGEIIGCFGLTEPDFGSNPGGMITRAEERDDHFLLNGAKMWITNSPVADLAVVWAKLEGKVRGFLVERGAEGFTTPETKHKWSLRASTTGEIVLQDVRIPKENILPEAHGLKAPLSCLTQARYGIAWGATGSAMACFEAARDYSLDRVQFDVPIASFQLVQTKLANMLSEITKAQLLCWRLGRLMDEEKATFAQVSLCKRNNVGRALEIAREARDMLGANGITYEYPVGRHMMNLESVNTYEGTYDIHGLILGEQITGIPAFNAYQKPKG